MLEFFRTEWKTILCVFLFCGAVFSWFYVDELKRRDETVAAPYQYSCLIPGSSLLGYKLGNPAESFDLSDFAEAADDAIHVKRYTSRDGSCILSFRDHILSSVSVRDERLEKEPDCKRDEDHFIQSSRTVSQDIPVAQHTNLIYSGVVRVEPNQTDGAAWWIVVPF